MTAHVTDGRGVQIPLDGGIDELAHMPCIGVSREQLATLAARGVVDGRHAPRWGALPPAVPDMHANARAFVAEGGRLLYGTDIPAVPATLDLVELGLLRQAGPRLETLTPGAPADLWVVRGDPTRSPPSLSRVRL